MFADRLHSVLCLMIVITILTPETEHVRSDVFQEGQNQQQAAQSDVFQEGEKQQAVNEVRQYCGRSLSGTLQMICGSVYNSRFKKSNQETDMDDYAFSYDLHPYKSIDNAKRMIRFRRNTWGIYEECCLKSCSTEELRTYCGIF